MNKIFVCIHFLLGKQLYIQSYHMFTFPLPDLTINNYLREEENFVDKLVSFEGFHNLSPQTTFHKPIPGWSKYVI